MACGPDFRCNLRGIASSRNCPTLPRRRTMRPLPASTCRSQATPGRPGLRLPVETPKRRQILAAGPQPFPEPTNPASSASGLQDIKTVPAGSATNTGESGRDELFRLQRTVSFVTVPVTVKDNEGKLVDGLLAKRLQHLRRWGQAADQALYQRSVPAFCRADH